MKKTSLYASRTSPYYIHAPAYSYSSAGIRVLHFLCHALRLNGFEAYLVTSRLNPNLNTGFLTAEIRSQHALAGVQPITVYPEVVHGNPDNADLIVRYLLNKPGFVGGPSEIDHNEILFTYKREFLPPGFRAPVLFLPTSDLSLFHPPADGCERSLVLWFVGRAKARLQEMGALDGHPPDAIELSYDHHRSPEELADLFRRAKVLYAYEPSATCTEAMLCGCPVLYVPNPLYGDIPGQEIFGRMGAALSTDANGFEHARCTVDKVRDIYLGREANFWRQLDRFIRLTQKLATERNASAMTTGRTAASGQTPYQLWRQRRSLQEIDGQLHAERMMSSWTHRPRFALGISLDANSGGLLANTIDSLARQWYAQWHLAIFAPGVDAPAELEGIEQIRWIGDPSVVASFATLRATYKADFYAMLPVGTMLDDHALQALADEINASPQWLAFYTDHDETGAKDAGPEPQFKPDFNPELLYSRNYIGPTAFVCGEALDAFGDGVETRSDSPLGLLLRISAQTGLATIGHVADPLLHCPQVPPDDQAEAATLRQHFERFGKPATIEEGWFRHTRRVRFARPETATVSAVVLTHSQPGYLQNCLESMQRTAGRKPDELILVAHAVSDPDLEAYIASLAAGALGIPCRVVREPGAFHPAAFRNRAASLASGDFLLFSDDDADYFQDGWLDALVGHASACNLAAVGPRLVSSTDGPPRIVGGGRILGLNGVAGEIGSGTPGILDGGFDLRLQVDQAISALPANCLLVRRADFEALGGFDEEAAPLLLHDLDFCLRAGEQGRRLAWLGTVDVAHQQSITVADETRSARAQAEWHARLEEERSALLERHLPTLANDPNYNRNYSLHSSHEVDLQAVADWNPRFHDRPRFLATPLTTGAGQYRVVAPFKALARAGLAQCTIIHPIGDNRLRTLSPVEIARLAPDVAVYQSCIEVPMIRQLAESARLNRHVEHIATIDDRLGDLPRDNPHYALHARQGRTRLRESLSHCRRLIVTTRPLQDYFADLIDDIRIVPNCLERDVWGGLSGAINEGERPRVGWVGAMQHEGDLKLIEPIMRALHGEADFVLMGMCPEFLKPFVKEMHPFVSITDYPRKMASLHLDLALAPLEIHPFNECKSNLRLLEYGALGWPVICTDIDPYRTDSPPVTRLDNRPDDWIAAIRQRIRDRDGLKREGTLLRRWVHDNYILEDHLDQWMTALRGQ